ncbi:unnamed protein product [Moneuplotes crassus]|uniref:Uncharacterized protein n=1 Tax=Euplotes crassus TaxID=5936 RepID=A0AAD1X6A6_EUPCR|nr:unnamed protein product [Moneuplotes crassus]
MYSASKETGKKTPRTISTPKLKHMKKYRKGCKVCVQCKNKEPKTALKSARVRKKSKNRRKSSMQKSNEKPINAKIMTPSETQESYMKAYDIEVFTPRRSEFSHIETQVNERDLGLDSFATQVENNKTKFVSLIEGIVGNMSTEYENLVKEKEKYSKIVQDIDPSIYITQIDELKRLNNIQEEQIDTLHSHNKSLSEKLETYAKEVKILDQKLIIKDQELSNCAKTLTENQTEATFCRQNSESQLPDPQEREQLEFKYKLELESLLLKIDKLEEHVKNLNSEVEKYKSLNKKLQEESNITKINYTDTKKEMTIVKNNLKIAEGEVNISRFDLEKLKKELEKYKSDCCTTQNELKKSKTNNEHFLSTIDELRTSIHSLKTKNKSKDDDIRRLQDEISFMKDILSKEAKEKEEALQKSLPEDIRKISALQEEILKFKVKLSDYENKIQKFDQDNEFLQTLLQNKEEVTKLQTRYTYVINLLTSMKGKNSDPRVIEYAENMISDGKSYFNKENNDSLIDEEDLQFFNQRLPSVPNDYDTYNLSRTNSEIISLQKNSSESPVRLRSEANPIKTADKQSIIELKSQLGTLRSNYDELQEKIKSKNRYIAQLEEANETKITSLNQSYGKPTKNIIKISPNCGIPEEESFNHDMTLGTDSDSDDGGLKIIEKEDMVQYLHTVSKIIEDLF